MAKRILVPIARVSPAPSLLRVLRDLAHGGGATVRLLHVAEPPLNVEDVDGRVIAYSDQERSRLEATARDLLETIALGVGGDAVESAVRFGDPAEEILAEAAEFDADLVVLGAGGRRRFLLVGGVVEQVLRRADAPVALMRAGHDEMDNAR